MDQIGRDPTFLVPESVLPGATVRLTGASPGPIRTSGAAGPEGPDPCPPCPHQAPRLTPTPDHAIAPVGPGPRESRWIRLTIPDRISCTSLHARQHRPLEEARTGGSAERLSLLGEPFAKSGCYRSCRADHVAGLRERGQGLPEPLQAGVADPGRENEGEAGDGRPMGMMRATGA